MFLSSLALAVTSVGKQSLAVILILVFRANRKYGNHSSSFARGDVN